VGASRGPSLRTVFLFVLVFGAILPLGIAGVWLIRSGARSGERLLADRLDETLAGVVSDIASRWGVIRSVVLDFAEDPVVQAALDGELAGGGPASTGESEEDALGGALRAFASRNVESFAGLTLRGRDGNEMGRVAIAGEGGRAFDPIVTMDLDLHPAYSDRQIGTLTADIRWSSLSEGSADWVGIAGSLLAVFRPDGSPVTAPGIDPTLIRQPRFALGDESWLGVSRSMAEPSLELVVAAPLDPFQRPFAEAARQGTLALALVALGSLVLLLIVTTRITGPLRHLASATAGVADGDLTHEVSGGGPRELAAVAEAFNAMTRRLRDTLRALAERESLAAVGEFAASLAHEVRNPLSSIRLDLQMVREDLGEAESPELTRALRTVDRLDHTVTAALKIARSGKVERRPLELGDALAAAIQAARPEFELRDVRLESDSPPDGAVISGDAAALEQVFLNLLLNAAQASPAAGRVVVATQIDAAGVSVTIADEGPGIPAEDRERVFEPFYSTTDEGTGLGLAMARRIVKAHGGKITIADAPGGASLTVRLPVAEAGAHAL